MIKSLININKQEKYNDVPKNIQQTIPIEKVWEDGIFQVGKIILNY